MRFQQASFTKGEMSDLMLARTNYDGYFKGASRLRNVLVIPQGAVIRRFGTTYKAAITDISADDQVQMTFLDYSDGVKYIIVFADLKIFIYYNDALVATVVSPYNDVDIPELNFTQSYNSLLIVHPTYGERHLIRTAAHAGWSLSTPGYKSKPGYDFERNYYTYTFTIQDNAGGTFDVAENKSGQLVRVTCSSAFFTAAMVGGNAFLYGGVIHFETFSSSTRMDGTITHAFDMKVDSTLTFDPTNMPGKDIVCTEPTFSATRGYASHVENFQNRVILANTETLPNGLFNSAYNGFYNNELDFDDTRTEDDAAFTIQVGDNRSEAIRSLMSASTLLIFTEHAVHSTNPLNDKGFSANNASILMQSTEGISYQVHAVNLDGKVIFAHDGGKIISALVYSAVKQKYEPLNLSLLSSHLILNPRKLLTYNNPNDIDGKLLFCINSDDGSMAILQIIEKENINAWTLCTTPGADGEFITGASSGSDTYFIVKRTINSSTVYYLEKLDFDVCTDSALTGTLSPAGDTITGLGHLEGEEVRIKSGNRVVDVQTVVSGSVTISEDIEDYEVGLNFTTWVRPMPMPGFSAKTGAPDPYAKRRINSVYVDYYQSLGIKVNGLDIPFRPLGVDEFFDPPLQDGTYKFSPRDGWEPRGVLDITQDEPYPMTILGIGYDIDLSGD